MTKAQFTIVGSAILAAAIVLFALAQRAWPEAAAACKEACAAQGKRFVITPPGTAGRMVDGANTRDDRALSCHCVSK